MNIWVAIRMVFYEFMYVRIQFGQPSLFYIFMYAMHSRT